MIAMASNSRADREQEREKRGGRVSNNKTVIFPRPIKKDHSDDDTQRRLQNVFNNYDLTFAPAIPQSFGEQATSSRSFEPSRERHHKEKKKKHSHDESSKSRSQKSLYRSHSKDASARDRSRRSPSASSMSSDKSDSHRKEDRHKPKHSSSDTSKYSNSSRHRQNVSSNDRHHDRQQGANSMKGAHSVVKSSPLQDMLSQRIISTTSTATVPPTITTNHSTFSIPKIIPSSNSHNPNDGLSGANRRKLPILTIPTKDPHDVRGILAEMSKPSFDSPISQILTPRKPELQFDLTDSLKKHTDNMLKSIGDASLNSTCSSAVEVKRDDVVNGNEVSQESDDSDSDSSSSSGSSSSSSGSDSSSDSDSDKEEEDAAASNVPPLSFEQSGSGSDNQDSSNKTSWNLGNFMHVKPTLSKVPLIKSEKKRRGRPRKGMSAAAPDSDPEFTPSSALLRKDTHQLPSVTSVRIPRQTKSAPKQSIAEKVEPTIANKVKSTLSSSSSSANSSPANSEDIEIDVVSPSSPLNKFKPISPFRPGSLTNNQSLTQNVPSSNRAKDSRQDPAVRLSLSPLTEKSHLQSAFSEPLSLPISIPLRILTRRPGTMRKPVKPVAPVISNSVKNVLSNGEASLKRKKKDPQPSIKIKRKRNDDSITEKESIKTPTSDSGKRPSYPADNSNLKIVPECAPDPEGYHQRGRKLKKEGTECNDRPLKHIINLESLLQFLLCGRSREFRQPTKVNDIRRYYESIDDFSEHVISDFKEEKIPDSKLYIFHLIFTLSHYTRAHMHFRVWKMSKDSALKNRRVVEDHLNAYKDKASVSPHQPSLPLSGGKGNRNSPCSPAPSPASITSTGSLTSTSDPGTITVPSHVNKCVGAYIAQSKRLISVHESWGLALTRQQLNHQEEFFQKLSLDVGYSLTIHMDTRLFVHYVQTGLNRLKSVLL